MTLLDIPLRTLRRALRLAEKREKLIKELASLGGGQPLDRRTNPGVRRYWREWRKQQRRYNGGAA